ncbi:MAG: acyl-CoA thioester hydrolase YciA [Legionellales bacterium]|nr:acyl-CoA thioester hydrolase YciA [Legionellales bacterium]
MTSCPHPAGELVGRTLAMPCDTNANGDIFGGWLVSEMDLGGGILAKRVSGGRIVTVAIHAMTFIRPVKIGDVVSCYAELIKTGRTSMTINIEAWATPGDGNDLHKVTEGTFIYVAIDEHGQPRPAISF